MTRPAVGVDRPNRGPTPTRSKQAHPGDERRSAPTRQDGGALQVPSIHNVPRD